MWYMILPTAWILSQWFCEGTMAEDSSLESIKQNMIQNFKVDLQHTLEGSRIRRKRQAGLQEVSGSNDFTAKHFRVGSSAPEELRYLPQNNISCWTGVKLQTQYQVFVGTKRGEYILFDVSENAENVTFLAYISDQTVGQKAKAFSFFGEQWFVVLQSNGSSTWIHVYQRNKGDIIPRQRMVLHGDSDFDLVTVRGVHYLVTVTYRTKINEEKFSYKGLLWLYHWANTQFDLITDKEIIVYGTSSVVTWSFDGYLYFATTQETNDAGNINLGSPVYMYNSKSEEGLMLLHRLQTTGPRKISHFMVSGNQYLVVIGRSNAQIYWWSNDQFLLWQMIDGTANAADVGVLSLKNGEVVVVITLKEKILFLTLDTTGHYIITFTMQFYGFDLASLQFMFDGQDFYALVLSSPYAVHYPPPVWKLALERYDLPDITSMDTLAECLKSLKVVISERQNELQAVELDMARIWVPDRAQVVSAPVIVGGSISSQVSNFSINNVIIHSNDTIDVLPSQIEEDSYDVALTKDAIVEDLDDVVFKNNDQEISGSVHFTSTVVVPSLYLPSVESDIFINDIRVDRLIEQTLKQSGNQTISGAVTVDQLFADSAVIGSINDKELNDLVLLQGSHFIDGNWQLSDVRMTDLTATTLNSIQLSRVVLTNSDQDISGLKHFDHLALNAISVDELTNGNNLRNIVENMVTLDSDQTVSARLQIFSPLIVSSGLSIELPINGEISLTTLDSQAVKMADQQDISGPKVFMSNLLVSGDMQVAGLTNGINLQQLMTLSTRQTVTSNTTFESKLSFQNLFVKSINGLDLNQDVVLKNQDHFISGHKIFQSTVTADSVDLTDGVTIDGVDISLEAEVVVKHVEGVIDGVGSAFSTIVTGNLSALSGINGFEVSDLPQIVWLKNQYQEINAPLTLKTTATFMSDLEARLVNNLNLATDVIHVVGDKSISEQVTFTDNVQVIRNADVANGKLLAGVDFSQFQEQRYLDKLYMDRMVRGTKTMLSLEVLGSLSSDDINGLNLVTDALQPSLLQTVYGDLEFSSANLSDLVGDRIDVEILNEFPLGDSIRSSVTSNNFRNISLTNKYFSNLKAHEMSISSNSKIDGVDLLDMFARAVMLNSQQTVLGQKVFDNSVHFEAPVVTSSINGLDIRDLVDQVIYTDQFAVVAGVKLFTGSVSAQNVISSSVNGFNLSEMAANSLSKTRNTDVWSRVVFANSVQAGSLYVDDNALIDDVSLHDVISLKDDVELHRPTKFESDVFLKNAFVTGLVNGCALDEISTYALRTVSNNTQIYSGQVDIETLEVSGDLQVQGNVNDVPLQILRDSVIGDSVYQVVVGDLYIHPGITVQNFQVNGKINETNLSDLMMDAVRKYSDQIIYASKAFRADLEVEAMSGQIDAFVSGTVNDVDVDRLFSTIVTKSEYQVLDGDKIFKDVIANNATVFEYLNGLRIPKDVVLTEDEEFIPSSVVIMRDIEISSKLTIEGKIDGFNLPEAIADLVTLDGDEVIDANVTFIDDVAIEGDLNVDGMVNDIPIEMVATVSKDTEIEGLKEFDESVGVHGGVRAGLVNDLDMDELYRNIVRHSLDETLPMQVFNSSVYIENGLSADLINGISLQSVQETFYAKSQMFQNALMDLKQSSVGYSEILSQYLKDSKQQVSQFAYFILHQEIFLGSSTKILTAYDEKYGNYAFSPLMLAMMTTRTKCHGPDACCKDHSTYWMKMDKMVTLTLAFGPLYGRYFPVVPVNYEIRTGKLVVWTQTSLENFNACSVNDYETVIGSIDSSGSTSEYLRIRDPSTLVDVAAFRDGYTYIVAAYFRDTVNDQYSPTIVYRGRESTMEWVEYQVLDMYGALSMDLTMYKSYDTEEFEVLLALGSGMGNYPDAPSSVYKWNSIQKKFDFVQNLLSEYVHSILWIQHGKQLLLNVASSRFTFTGDLCTDSATGRGQIDVYLYRGRLHLIQSLQLPGVVSMVYFVLQDELYFAAASRHLQTIVIYQMQGYSGFKPIQFIPSEDVSHLNTFQQSGQLYLTVASGKGHSKILKAIVRGQSPDVSRFDLTNSTIIDERELADDPLSIKKSTC